MEEETVEEAAVKEEAAAEETAVEEETVEAAAVEEESYEAVSQTIVNQEQSDVSTTTDKILFVLLILAITKVYLNPQMKALHQKKKHKK